MNGFATIAAFALLLVRPGMLVMGTPLLGAVQAPAPLRIGLTLLIAIVLAPFVALPAALTMGQLVLVVLREAAIGAALMLAIQVLVAGAEFAGHFAGYQIGLSIGSLIDPQSGVRNNILALVYGNVVTIICLAANAHHALLHALADSYAALPIGGGGVDASLAASIARTLGLVFVIGVRIAAPVIVVLLLVEASLGLLARVAPSLNVITAGAPVRVIVGLLVMAASITALPGLIGRYIPTAFQAAAGVAQAFR
jgi:flagellar biosynthetic protein FliR